MYCSTVPAPGVDCTAICCVGGFCSQWDAEAPGDVIAADSIVGSTRSELSSRLALWTSKSTVSSLIGQSNDSESGNCQNTVQLPPPSPLHSIPPPKHGSDRMPRVHSLRQHKQLQAGDGARVQDRAGVWSPSISLLRAQSTRPQHTFVLGAEERATGVYNRAGGKSGNESYAGKQRVRDLHRDEFTASKLAIIAAAKRLLLAFFEWKSPAACIA
ncbi:hypothetical protein PybrP1_012771 [[Pythium] brassicae (nom. inval.)]|nr:hypothetical protein PybrP1_012771 [[Pythium] brassicae (nom. inval.)]